MRKKPANDTDHFKLTRTVATEFKEQCDFLGSHQIFRALGGRHFQVELYGSNQMATISVRRLAYALQNPHDHVGADEEVWTTCEHKGNHQTGDGTCVAHLRKVSKEEAQVIRAHCISSHKLVEATV